ncbi:hypothetical protein BC827DRAFT_1234502, partial [Russula dissimulans]
VLADKIPLLHRKRRMGTQWEYDSNLTGVYLVSCTRSQRLAQRSRIGMRLSPVSAGLHLRRDSQRSLVGGAHVVVTTSSYSCTMI